MINVNQKRSDFQSPVLGTQTMHIHFIYEKEYFRVCHMVRIPMGCFCKIYTCVSLLLECHFEWHFSFKNKVSYKGPIRIISWIEYIYRRFAILSMIRTLIAIMAARIIVGNRGRKVLIYKGFKYQQNRERASAIYWRCWRQECRANLRTCTFNIEDESPNTRVLHEGVHNHEEDDGVNEHDNILNSMKEVIRQDPSVLLKRVYDSVNRHHVRRGGGDREHIPEFHRIRTSMTRSRLEHVPEVPH